MPNWCKNNLKIIGNGEKVLELLELVKDDNGDFTFTKFLPLPKELENTQSPASEDTLEQKCLNEKLRKKYGADNWYDWQVKNWGCKWDAGESAFYKDGDNWMISFQTPWGPPVEFFKELSKKFPKMEFVMQFADECIGGTPLGEATIEDGLLMYNGPEEGQNNTEQFSYSIWDEMWVDDWSENFKYKSEEEE